jgi:hypothetical protein
MLPTIPIIVNTTENEIIIILLAPTDVVEFMLI